MRNGVPGGAPALLDATALNAGARRGYAGSMKNLLLAAAVTLAATAASGLEPWDGRDKDLRLKALARTALPAVVLLEGAGSLGSGYLIDPRGYLVTNNHVAEAALGLPADGARPSIKVLGVRRSEPERPDGPPRRFPRPDEHGRIDPASLGDFAELVAVFPGRDLALLRIVSTATWSALPLGDDEDAGIGDSVAAFGAPFGQGGTMTQGTVSTDGAVRRPPQFRGMDTDTRVIQTQAPLNPGNSGGPVLDLRRGRVVGTVFGGSGPTHTGVNFFIAVSETKDMWGASGSLTAALESRMDADYAASVKRRVAAAIEDALRRRREDDVVDVAHRR